MAIQSGRMPLCRACIRVCSPPDHHKCSLSNATESTNFQFRRTLPASFTAVCAFTAVRATGCPCTTTLHGKGSTFSEQKRLHLFCNLAMSCNKEHSSVCVQDVAVEKGNPFCFWSASLDGRVHQFDLRVANLTEPDAPNMLIQAPQHGGNGGYRRLEFNSLDINNVRSSSQLSCPSCA
jgi:hypothetical protein